ncbi:J domain-containing protein [Mangrovicella endophytica]|uniref:J domain-containing protein n=1 Tax=Mangrovicella endophytica TaxID=2066697 RepID=UPI000C9E00B5|nr:DnaJ family molecular chaperone [Mangrovicella endophytica]
MKFLSSLSALFSALPSGSRATLDALIEGVRTLFSGDRQTRRGVAFSVAMIALSAKMAKADGIVTPEEVTAFQQIFHIPAEEMRNVFRLYDLAKKDTAGFDSYASRLAGLCQDSAGDCTLLADVLDGLFHIAKADGVVHERELVFLEEIAGIFGLSEGEFDKIRLRHVAGAANPYLVLGLEGEPTPEAARQRYLELVRENHPDRLAARGVPDEFLLIATERMKAINAAYASISGKSAA